MDYWHVRTELNFTVNPGTGYKVARITQTIPDDLHSISVLGGSVSLWPPVPTTSKLYQTTLAVGGYVEYTEEAHVVVLFDVTVQAFSEPHEFSLIPIKVSCIPLAEHRVFGLDVMYGGKFDAAGNPVKAIVTVTGSWTRIRTLH